MMKINPQAHHVFVRQRKTARETARAIVHSFPPNEPHDTDGEINEEGLLCWCTPDIEDFSEQGGGALIIHRGQTWQ